MGYRPEDQAVPKREGSMSSDVIIRDATVNSLRLAENLGRSIAFQLSLPMWALSPWTSVLKL
jgi:hypothetical protein